MLPDLIRYILQAPHRPSLIELVYELCFTDDERFCIFRFAVLRVFGQKVSVFPAGGGIGGLVRYVRYHTSVFLHIFLRTRGTVTKRLPVQEPYEGLGGRPVQHCIHRHSRIPGPREEAVDSDVAVLEQEVFR